MSYTYPTGAALGASKAGLAIGYRLVNLDGTQNQAFTTTGVVETAVPGTYTVTGGISLPDGFSGTIEWGTSTTKYAVEWIGPGVYENGDVKVSSRLATASYTAPPTAAALAAAVWTDTTAGDFTVAGSPGQVLTSRLDTTVGSRSAPATAQTIDLTTLVPVSDLSGKVTQTVADCLSAARAHGAGKETVIGTLFTLYGPDGVTIVRQFTLDAATNPSQRA